MMEKLLLWTEWQTHMTENITFATPLMAVNVYYLCESDGNGVKPNEQIITKVNFI